MALFRRKPGTDIEVRDPTAATQSVRYMTPGRAQPPDWNAAQAFRIANGTVLACVDYIGKYLSECPFRVGADPEKPEDYDPRSPLARLLSPPPGGPNPDTSARRFWKWTVGQYMLAGRWAWELELGASDIPVALWALPASSLTPIPSTSGQHYFTGYEYGPINNRKTLGRDRVVYDWIQSADDWRQPDPPLRRAYLDTMIAIMQTRYDYAFLKNDARPSVIVVTEEFAEEEDLRAFETQWNSSYGGPENAGRVAVVEAEGGTNGVTGAIDVKVLGITPRDAQAAQRYDYRIKQIAANLGVPWSILDASGRTFDNASQEWDNFVRGTLRPIACDLADVVNMQLAPRFGQNVGWFDLSGLGVEKRDDPVTQPATAPVMVQAQLMTINEGRADYGLPPVPDGDRMMTADEIAALRGGAPVAAGGTTMSAAPEARKLHQSIGDPCTECGKPAVHQAHGYFIPNGFSPTTFSATSVREVIPAPAAAPSMLEPPAPPEDRGETAEEAEARRTKVWKANDSKVRALERAFEEDMARLFRRQARSVLARLEHKRARRQVSEVRALTDEVFDPDHWVTETIDETRGLYRNIALAAGGAMADRFGIAFDLQAPYVQDFINARANQLAGQVTDTTYRAIQDALGEGVSAGESISDLANRIEHVFDIASTSRATTIARTETISAYNGASAKVAEDYGPEVVGGQEWIATRDNRTRDGHAERDGEVVPMGQAFSGGLMYPGDPSGDPGDTVNCRCTVAYLTPEEMVASNFAPAKLPGSESMDSWAESRGIDLDTKVLSKKSIAEQRAFMRAYDEIAARYRQIEGMVERVGYRPSAVMGTGAEVQAVEGPLKATSASRVYFTGRDMTQVTDYSKLVANNADEAWIHEMGHVVHNSTPWVRQIAGDGASVTPSGGSMIRAAANAADIDRAFIRSEISEYALTDDRELFAEIFTLFNRPGGLTGLAPETVTKLTKFAQYIETETGKRVFMGVRSVPLPIARAVMALIRTGPFDERAVRGAVSLAS